MFWLLKYVRENILEKFILPELNLSYWEFCIYLAIAGVVIVVLVNAVQVSGSLNLNSRKENNYHQVLRQRERVKADERSKIRNGSSSTGSYNLDKFEEMLNNK